MNSELQAEITAAEYEIEAAKQRRETAAEKLERLTEQANEANAEIKAMKEAIAASDAAEIEARKKIIDAERRIAPPPVTLEIAKEAAARLIDSFEEKPKQQPSHLTPAYEPEPTNIEERAKQTWDTIDDVRCRLLTEEVADDARRIVMAVEAVVAACDEWERQRIPQTLNYDESNVRSMSVPQHSGLVKALMSELKRVLEGTVPNRVEPIGELIAQNVPLQQICKIYGFMKPDGREDLSSLGSVIDSALSAGGFYYDNSGSQWLHLRRMGAITPKQAWTSRQNFVGQRKQIAENMPGAAARGTRLRAGRKPN